MARKSKATQKRVYVLQKRSLVNYFTPERWDDVYPFLSGGECSRRFIDHLLTSYSRTHRVEWEITLPGGGREQFNLYQVSQSYLENLHKRGMDTFNRKNNYIENGGIFTFGHGEKMIRTSVCQLTLYRFLHRYKVLDWIRNQGNADVVRADMEETSKARRKEHRERKRRRTAEISSTELTPITDVVVSLSDVDEVADSDEIEENLWKMTNRMILRNRKKRRRRPHTTSKVNFTISNAPTVTVLND